MDFCPKTGMQQAEACRDGNDSRGDRVEDAVTGGELLLECTSPQKRSQTQDEEGVARHI